MSFTLAPSRPRQVDSHWQALTSTKAQVVRSSVLTADSIETDALIFRNGDEVVNANYFLMREIGSLATPPSGQGRVWLRNNAPTRVIFSDDNGTETALSPSLGEVLAADSDAGAANITGVAGVTFNSGVAIGTVDGPSNGASAVSNVAIGRDADAPSPATNATAIGATALTSHPNSTAVGSNAQITSQGGGVAVGRNIASRGPSVCIGHDISNTADQQDAQGGNVFLGQDIDTITQEVCEVDAGGMYVALGLGGGSPTFGQYFSLYNANDAASYYLWMDNGGGANDPAPGGFTAGVEVDVVAATAEEFTAEFSGQALQTGAGSADYLIVNAANNAVTFYVWFSDGTNTAPTVTSQVLVPVDISGAPTDATIATRFAAALNALDFFSAPAPGGTLVTVTCADTGPTTSASNANASSVAVTTTTEGSVITTDQGIAAAISGAINASLAAHFTASASGTIVRITNVAAGPSTDVENVNVGGMTVAVIEQGVVGGGAVGIGRAIVPSSESIVVGATAASLGGSAQVCLGFGSEVGSSGSIAIGKDAHAADDADYLGAGNCVAIGGEANASNALSVAVGFRAATAGQGAIALGTDSVGTGGTSLAIGSAAQALQTSSIAIGAGAVCNFANSTCIGNGVQATSAEEFAVPGFSTIRGSVSTSTGASTTLLDFSTETNHVYAVEGSIVAYRRTGDTTYLASIDDFHFRNKAGTLTKATDSGTLTEDTAEAAYSVQVTAVGTSIRVVVTGVAGHTVDWTGLLRIWASS